MQRLLFFLFILTTNLAAGQNIKNLKAEVKDNQVYIQYDLLVTAQEQTFDVLLFSSVNKYTRPLEFVTGDVGKNIVPGEGKVIIWNPESELIKFKGEVIFELQVKVFTPFVFISKPTENSSLRRGTTQMIEWTGANANTRLQMDLYQDEVKLSSIESTENTGRLKWSLPTSLKPAGNYKILIYEMGKSDNRAFSKPFSIKRKIPNAAKISIAVMGAGLIGYLISAIGSAASQPEKIPPPINPN